jgi:hypothetical protein
MNTIAAIASMMDLINASAALLLKTQQISALIAKAQAEERDMTDEELDSIIKEDDAIRVVLNDEVLRHIGKQL